MKSTYVIVFMGFMLQMACAVSSEEPTSETLFNQNAYTAGPRKRIEVETLLPKSQNDEVGSTREALVEVSMALIKRKIEKAQSAAVSSIMDPTKQPVEFPFERAHEALGKCQTFLMNRNNTHFAPCRKALDEVLHPRSNVPAPKIRTVVVGERERQWKRRIQRGY